ncbi:PREDICTED: SLAM family member 9-like [Poecilia mexicana]|uniref:SLAM family member 9-like n=1 Tax=Poecilia mexicana TaxID=48701 RepID=UPI00072E5ADC|nr:PREDICTED: SLAM family member 9-like [Poecilia mexicana]
METLLTALIHIQVNIFNLCFPVTLGLSAGQEVKENLTGTVGGTVTLPGAVTETETGFLSYGRAIIASVTKGELDFDVDTYQNRLQWNRSSGLFKITNLQRNDSGIYTVQRGEFSSSYNLQIYDPAPTPAVTAVDVTSDLCLLTCSVDKPATLLWIRDQEIQTQNRSAPSLTVTVHKEDRASSYRCAAANPAENKTVDVDVTILCGFNETETPNDRRSYWIPVVVSVVVLMFVAFGVWMVKLKFLGRKEPAGQTQNRSGYSSPPEVSPQENDPTFTTVIYRT